MINSNLSDINELYDSLVIENLQLSNKDNGYYSINNNKLHNITQNIHMLNPDNLVIEDIFNGITTDIKRFLEQESTKLSMIKCLIKLMQYDELTINLLSYVTSLIPKFSGIYSKFTEDGILLLKLFCLTTEKDPKIIKPFSILLLYYSERNM